MKKIHFYLGIFFGILSIIGAVFVIANGGEKSPGYTMVPMIFSIAFMSDYKRSVKNKTEKEETNKYKYTKIGIIIGLFISSAATINYIMVVSMNVSAFSVVAIFSIVFIFGLIGLFIDKKNIHKG